MALFHETAMGRKFLEGTMPRIANALEKLHTLANQFMKETAEAEKEPDVSQFKDPYVNLAFPENFITHEMLDAGSLNLRVQVKLEEEGVVVDLLQGDEPNNSIESVWKLYDEMASGEEIISRSAHFTPACMQERKL